jgi:hypothetical protein
MARLLAALFVLSLVVAAAAAPVPKGRPRGPEYFPTAVGTKWVYDHDGLECVEEIIRAEPRDGGTRLTVQVTAPQPIDDTFRVTREGVFWLTFGGLEMDQYRLRFPLKAGNSWGVRTPIQPGLGDASAGRMTVGEEETVEVPAGTYRAVPVKFDMTEVDGQPLARPKHHIFWYAPGVGLVKHKLPYGQRVLKSFTPG